MPRLRPWPSRLPPPRRFGSGSGRDIVGAPPPQPPRRLLWCLRRPFLAHQRRGTGNTPTRVSRGPPPHTANRSVTGGKDFTNLYAMTVRAAIVEETSARAR